MEAVVNSRRDSVSKVCLLVIFNNRFEKNLDKLRAIYRDRFSHVYFLMPFYQGNAPDVLSVWDNSYRFHAFFAQAYERFAGDYDHYFAVADDILLNPAINEDNLAEYFGLLPGQSMCCAFEPLAKTATWPYRQIFNSLHAFEDARMCSWRTELPPLEKALERAAAYGADDLTIEKNFTKNKYWRKENLEYYWRYPKHTLKLFRHALKLPYPMVYGYSDFFIVHGSAMREFCRLAGILGAMDVHVETATPTAMMLACDSLKTYGTVDILHGKQNGDKLPEGDTITEKLAHWDASVDFIHPVKLSGLEL